ncbi:MAG: hypothetical protein ABI887_19965, partial [Burkholderiales bacterium]
MKYSASIIHAGNIISFRTQVRNQIDIDAPYDPPLSCSFRKNTMCGIVGAVSTKNIVPILI